MVLVVVMIMLMRIAANPLEHYVSGIAPSTLDIRSILANSILMSYALCLFPLYGWDWATERLFSLSKVT